MLHGGQLQHIRFVQTDPAASSCEFDSSSSLQVALAGFVAMHEVIGLELHKDLLSEEGM